MSEQTVLLPDIKYFVEKIVEEVAESSVAGIDLHVEVPIGGKRCVLWLKVKVE
jgi:hypothetical protein